jgi:hypothetical protein
MILPVFGVFFGQGFILDARRFSAFFSSAARVKFKLPVTTVSPSMIMTLLQANARAALIIVGFQYWRKSF